MALGKMDHKGAIKVQRKIIFNRDDSASAAWELDSTFSVQIFYLETQVKALLRYEDLLFLYKQL